MSVFAEVIVPSTAFALGRALEERSDARIELERVVPVGGTPLPYFWITATARAVEAFETAARSEPAIAGLTAIDAVGERTLYRCRWNAPGDDLLGGLRTSGATVLEAAGDGSEWRFELRFDERDDVRDFQRYCTARGVDLDFARIRPGVEPEPSGTYGLTPLQRETLAIAHERGYFDEPRRVTLAELAAAFDVSERALSRRLTRGIDRLVENTVTAGERADGRSPNGT